MWQQEFTWFFTIFHHEFRKNNPIAFEVLMVLAVANLFGFYNPKQLADFLDVPHQKFYTELKALGSVISITPLCSIICGGLDADFATPPSNDFNRLEGKLANRR